MISIKCSPLGPLAPEIQFFVVLSLALVQFRRVLIALCEVPSSFSSADANAWAYTSELIGKELPIFAIIFPPPKFII